MENTITRRALVSLAGCAASQLVFPLNSPTQGQPVFNSVSNELTGKVRLGVIADLHGGLAVDASSRLDAFLESMEKNGCDALIQLGDFAFPNPKHQDFADRLNAAHKHVIHVIGNHEFDFGLKRADCYRAWGIQSSYYQYDIKGVRILVLDGNEKGSPTHGGGYPSYIGEAQLKWLEKQLRESPLPVIVLSHQPLAGPSTINNSKQIQDLLAVYKKKVALCVNGHSHLDALFQVKGVSYLHHNSASYFWVGGKERMAYYDKPLFSVLELDFERGLAKMSACTGQWKTQSPKQMGYFQSENRPSEEMVVPEIRGRGIPCESLSAS